MSFAVASRKRSVTSSVVLRHVERDLEPFRETPDATRDERAIAAIRHSIEMSGGALYGGCGGLALAGSLVRVREVQVQRREEAFRSSVGDALRMMHGERV